jgi:hypothetical protein
MMGQRSLKILRSIKFLAYVLVVSVPMLVEHVGETPERDPTRPTEQAVSGLVLRAPIGYQHVTELGFRQPMPHLVQIVALRQDESSVWSQNICERRLFLSKLLEKIEHQRPSLIVVDMFFPEGACLAGDSGTDALQKTITTSDVPIVVGLGTYTPWEYTQPVRNGESPDAKPLVSEAQFQPAQAARLVLMKALELETNRKAVAPGNVMAFNSGLTRLSSNVLQIPLRWPVYDVQSNGDLGDVRLMRSLALVAAEVYEREISNGIVSSRLNDLVENGTFPFISNLVPEKSSGTENGIPVTDAIELFCGKSEVRDWTNCNSQNGDLTSAAPIVMVGEEGPAQDTHQTPFAMMSGPALQANYIEALLEERYITPLSQRVTLVFNILWVGIVELAFFVWPVGRALKYSALATLAILAITYFVLLEWGFFVVLWTLALAIFSPGIRALEELKHVLVHG